MRLVYRQFAPCPELRALIARYYTLTATHRPRAGELAFHPHDPLIDRLLPNGDLNVLIDRSGRSFGPRRSWLGRCATGVVAVGAIREPVRIEFGPHTDVLGVAFQPGRSGAILDADASALTDRAVPLEHVAGGFEPALREGRLDEAFVDRGRGPLDDRVDAAVRGLGRDPSVRIEALSAGLGVARQHLTREFRRMVGVNPKRYSRMARYQRVLAACTSEAVPRWSRVALECGYYDQAHMVTEFKAMTGLTPERLRRVRAPFHSSNTRPCESA